MTKKLRVAEWDYGPEEVESLRTSLIHLRDEMVKTNIFPAAVTLTQTIALLDVIKKELWP